MKSSLESSPTTLGEKLSEAHLQHQNLKFGALVLSSLLRLLACAVIVCVSAAALWLSLDKPALEFTQVFIFLSAITVFCFLKDRGAGVRGKRPHFLLVNDRHGFVRNLRLDQKTAVFDGSNIYHLGHENKLDAQPLGEIAQLLRSQGYRIVCFFDANIFHTIGGHGAFQKDTRHSPALLERIFGLNADEIYVVPSGVQADKYILECLALMPISFAVTNDRFRDYASQYPNVMKDNLWRKGVVISDGKTKLLHH